MTASARHRTAARAKIVVVKVGSRVLTDEQGLLDVHRVEAVARQVDAVLATGRQVVLVSSGAVSAGMGRLGLDRRPEELAHLQAVAAVGQSCLIESYERVLRDCRRHAAQVLLVAEDLHDRRRYLNIRNTLRSLLDFAAVPIVNENDTVSVEELRTSFGDNDHLAAQVAMLLPAELLVLLSDVAGLYDRAPDDPAARLVPQLDRIDGEAEAFVHDSAGGRSKGGMASKLAAARAVTAVGTDCVIAAGREPGVLEAILRGEEVGTLFPSASQAVPARKRWLGWTAQCRGLLAVDRGARAAVVGRGSSLLAAGVCSVEGSFTNGDLVGLVSVEDPSRRIFARGLVNYTAEEVRRIAGLKTGSIAGALGTCPYDEVVHRDNLSVLQQSTPCPQTPSPGQDTCCRKS